MSSESLRDRQLQRVADLHRPREFDHSLAFLRTYFKRHVDRPHRQLKEVISHWQALVPTALQEHCRLEGLTRYVLRVGVDSSAHLYELDRRLRSGLETELIRHVGRHTLRRVQLRLVEPERTRRDQPSATSPTTD